MKKTRKREENLQIGNVLLEKNHSYSLAKKAAGRKRVPSEVGATSSGSERAAFP